MRIYNLMKGIDAFIKTLTEIENSSEWLFFNFRRNHFGNSGKMSTLTDGSLIHLPLQMRKKLF